MRRLHLALVLATACSAPVPPAPGGPCKGEDTATCEAATARMLLCKNSAFEIYSDCKGANGCKVDDQTATCDTSGNTVGDRCPPTSEGKVRCDPDGGAAILRCVDGGLANVYTCPAGTICGINDAGLTCF